MVISIFFMKLLSLSAAEVDSLNYVIKDISIFFMKLLSLSDSHTSNWKGINRIYFNLLYEAIIIVRRSILRRRLKYFRHISIFFMKLLSLSDFCLIRSLSRYKYFNLLYEAIIIVSIIFFLPFLFYSMHFNLLYEAIIIVRLFQGKVILRLRKFQSSLWSYYHCQVIELRDVFVEYVKFQSSLWSYYHCQGP